MYSKRIDWCGFVVALLLALSVVAMSVLAILPLTSQNVCFADSSNGIVESNIFYNPDFSISNEHLVPNVSIGTLVAADLYKFGDCTVSISNNLSFYNNSGSGGLRFLFSGSQSTYTVTISGTNLSGKYFRVRNLEWYSYSTITISSTYYTNNLFTYTFTLDSSSYNNIYMLQLDFQGAWSSVIDWIKIEQGSSFTGYVPRDYEHYGYNEGYDDGIQYMVDRQLLTNGVELLGSFPIVAIKYGTDGVWDSFYYNNNFSVLARQGNPLLPPYDSFEYNGNTYCVTGPSPSGSLPPQYFNFLDYDSSNYTMSVSVPAWGNNYWSIFPIAYEVRYIGQSIYFTSDFVFGSPYRLIIRSTDGTNLVFVSDFTMSGNYNGVNFVDLTKYLVSGQSYNFYVTKTSANTALSFSTKNSYFTGISSLCIFTINDAYTVGVNNYDKGYSEGYNVGYSSGYQQGDNAGYNRGVDESSDYGFYGLIGSAIDVPINAITGLLDFDLLGVNMKAFFLSIFSLAVLIVIVRLIVGGLS